MKTIGLDAIRYARINPIAGVRIIESIHATALPTGKPYADDTREMIEHFERLGLIARKPAAFQTPAGMVVHPAILAGIRQHLSAEMDRAFYKEFR